MQIKPEDWPSIWQSLQSQLGEPEILSPTALEDLERMEREQLTSLFKTLTSLSASELDSILSLLVIRQRSSDLERLQWLISTELSLRNSPPSEEPSSFLYTRMPDGSLARLDPISQTYPYTANASLGSGQNGGGGVSGGK